ncbi:hypothetical protein J3Q64DRAFT_1864718 [Phycomyces blakesleeanus]|uniref:Uncharacterized protein n=2 Tax=Phycomyces blakesleeanus TaxID=4837 RepID=A0A162U705_PHYB8|nr:hypothetical protein PHYBLDRAFT_169151 [Phycomyces blakesleeanus NRRL 1555(-)]OAD72893.1 hypothetical protein PHYBLDRAFT_169151 [Phycomyces blakesleeanus NRRL 1555(-)]|eukprot:XP_018290933.1 hypothetical protein PHYBLDRAFT_169151 [Phycomyces blakesleeanus NRRL 1555(-)]
MEIYDLLSHKQPRKLTISKADSSLPEVPTRETLITERSVVNQESQNIVDLPSRAHWKPYSSTTLCGQKGCSNVFGVLIFCDRHCSESIRLDKNALFNSKGVLCRGCDKCVLYYLWEILRTKKGCTDEADIAPNTRDKHRSIMTLEPQAMEGIMEIGRDDIILPAPVSDTEGGYLLSLGKFDPIPYSALDGWQWSTF